MAANRIVLNETSYFGKGAREVLPDEIKRRKFKKALLVTDKMLVQAGVAKMVTDVLDKASVAYEIYDEVKPNPSVTTVKNGIDKFKSCGADYLIAVGGGSPIDTAKAIGIVVANPEFSDIVSLEGVANTKNKSVPLIALPTTAGTAAEVTINYVITDEKSVKKMVCVDVNDIPVAAIVDTELMKGMPKSVAASTGMDALTHAIEGYLTKGAWEMTDMFHLKAIEMIYKNLEKAVEKDDEAVYNMGIAQYIAGMGFSNVGLGIVHSMAHSLGAVYDTPHGVANALLLPYVMEYNSTVSKVKFKGIGKAFGISGIEDMSDDKAVDAVLEAVRKLSKAVGIPQKLNEIGVKEEDFRMLAEKSMADACTPGNPRNPSTEDIINIYAKAY